MANSKTTVAYHHGPVIEQQEIPTVDPRPGHYYVTVRDGKRHGFLLGPYRTHQEAIDMVPTAKALAYQQTSWAHFYHYGTAAVRDGYPAPGLLNSLLEKEDTPA